MQKKVKVVTSNEKKNIIRLIQDGPIAQGKVS